MRAHGMGVSGWWRAGMTVLIVVVSGCTKAPQAPVAYYVPAAAEQSERREATRCFKRCRVANAEEGARFRCVRACAGVTVTRNRTCSQVGQSVYVSCVDREEDVPGDQHRPKPRWGLIAAITAGVLGAVFIANSPLFEEREGKRTIQQ